MLMTYDIDPCPLTYDLDLCVSDDGLPGASRRAVLPRPEMTGAVLSGNWPIAFVLEMSVGAVPGDRQREADRDYRKLLVHCGGKRESWSGPGPLPVHKQTQYCIESGPYFGF